jgi:hypothetical protein
MEMAGVRVRVSRVWAGGCFGVAVVAAAFFGSVVRDQAAAAAPCAPSGVKIVGRPGSGGKPPTVSVKTPASGATLAGSVVVSACAADNDGIAGVQFRLDGVNLGTEATLAPYSMTWDTTTTPNGSHTLSAVARDNNGNSTTSAAVTVTIANTPPDTTPPSVSITAPAASATVSGTVSVTADASDNVGVAGVQFKLDGATLGAEDATSPYSVSWTTTTASNGTHTLTAVARDVAGNTKTSAGVAVTVSNVSAGGGIASAYPGDVGIENDPNVVFVERFNEGTLSSLFARWGDVKNGSVMSFSSDVPAGSPVATSLTIPWLGGAANDGGHLYRQITPAVTDTLYVRFYIKYPLLSNYTHSGVWMGGYNPASPWPNPQAGLRPNGADRFSSSAEKITTTGALDHYDYWTGMHQSADGNYWGNLLLNNPSFSVAGGQWTCVEQMIKLNNPVTAANGESAIWLNGTRISYLGPGFPNGTWSGGIFTQSPAGSPFSGFQWRTDANLNINYIWLQNYTADTSAGTRQDMKFAHLVAAKSYIGCLAPSGPPDTTAPTVLMTAPAAAATVSGSAVTVSATASDNVGVAGVQFKVDGANLGAEDTSGAYSLVWDTSAVPNGSHTLAAIARDAAGNTTTSAPVTVTVANVVGVSWPNEPAGMTGLNDQPWNLLTGLGWNYLRRTSSKDDTIVADAAAPFSAPSILRIVFTTDMLRDSEPSVHWMSLPGTKEIYTAWWMKISPNWSCSPAGCAKMTFLYTSSAGQVYTNIYHNATDNNPPYRIGVNTEWAPYGQQIWYPNVTTTPINPGEWHRIEVYYRWETTPGVSSDGIIRYWVDGVLNGNHTNVHYPAQSFIEFQYAPTLQNPPPAEQYMYIDHTRVRWK